MERQVRDGWNVQYRYRTRYEGTVLSESCTLVYAHDCAFSADRSRGTERTSQQCMIKDDVVHEEHIGKHGNQMLDADLSPGCSLD